MRKHQPIRWRKAGLSSQEGGSRAAADTEGEEAEHVREGGRGRKVELGRQRDAVPQCVSARLSVAQLLILSSGTVMCYGATMHRSSAEAGNADRSSP